MGKQLTVGLNCLSCGGAITVTEGECILNCRYCGSTLFIEGDNGISTVALKNKLDRSKAIDTIHNWWRKGLKARDLRGASTITEAYSIYLPFWSMGTRIAGWVCGYEERTTEDPEGNTRTERIHREEMVLMDLSFSEIACDPRDLGIRSLHNLSGEASFEDMDQIPSFNLTTSRDDAMAHAKAEGIARGRSKAGIPNITFESLHALVRNQSMIHYPIWVVRYTYQGRMYIATVDGVTGKVISGRAPGDPLYQSLAVTAGTSLGGLAAAGGIIALMTLGSEAGVIGIILGMMVMGTTYWFFRHGSEIVQGDFDDQRGKSFSRMVPGAETGLGDLFRRHMG